jgi:hypothetical protein
MGLLTNETLLKTLDRRLACASSVDVAVAWATRGPALDRLVAFADRRNRDAVRAVVGTWSHITDPQVLELLDRSCRLHIVCGEYAHFHPKYYRFNNGTRAWVWIGSANLTHGGFSDNTELVFETEGDAADRAWFDAIFREPTADNRLLIAEYRARLNRTAGKGEVGDRHREVAEMPEGGHPIGLIKGRLLTWPGYLSALRTCDRVLRTLSARPGRRPFAVYSLPVGYLATIAAGNRALAQEDWSYFAPRDQHAILGIEFEGHDYGHLGCMRRAGEANDCFTIDTPAHVGTRRRIRDALADFAAGAPANLPEAGQRCIDTLRRIDGVGVGVASRLMALSVPDRAIAVNGGSRAGLEALTGIPAVELGAGREYNRLLAWLQRQPWHGSLEPKDDFERQLWRCRAALLDAFVAGYGG